MDIESVINVSLLATTFTTLFVIMDPPGTIPVFLALTGRMNRSSQNRAATQATLTSLFVIVGFALLGNYILTGLRISMEALQVSGGILLFLVAMELLMGKGEFGGGEGEVDSNIALVPLGTPLLAGPGAIVAVMVAVNQGKGSVSGWVAVAVAVLLMHLVIWLTMRFSLSLHRLLGDDGVLILTKISGVLLAAIATQLVADGVFAFISGYRGGL